MESLFLELAWLPSYERRLLESPSLTIDMRGEGSFEPKSGGSERPVPSASILDIPLEFLYMDGLLAVSRPFVNSEFFFSWFVFPFFSWELALTML